MAQLLTRARWPSPLPPPPPPPPPWSGALASRTGGDAFAPSGGQLPLAGTPPGHAARAPPPARRRASHPARRTTAHDVLAAGPLPACRCVPAEPRPPHDTMAWFMRGVQSAVFHYASCAPCTGYSEGRRRRRDAQHARKARARRMLEEPDTYHHPEPTGTNPYWREEIAMGPGPPPRRARRTGTGSSRCITTAGTHSSAVSKLGSSLDGERAADVRCSDDTLAPATSNRRRYQRDDEELWGHDEPPALAPTAPAPTRTPAPSRSASYASARAPPVHELHPPVVSLPPTNPSATRWMLQPPPKASLMAGKDRAHSGASSRLELSLGRQASTRQLVQKLQRRFTADVPSVSPASSYSSLACPQPARNPQARQRRDTATSTMTRTNTHASSANNSSDALARGSTTTPPMQHAPTSTSTTVSDTKPLRTHNSRPVLSTIISTDSGIANAPLSPILHSPRRPATSDENLLPEKPSPVHYRFPSDLTAYPRQNDRTPLNTSDTCTLNRLQDLVSPRALLASRFVSAPLVEARLPLPPSEEDIAARAKGGAQCGGKRGWAWNAPRDTETSDEQIEDTIRVPFDSFGGGRDVGLRWSVDF